MTKSENLSYTLNFALNEILRLASLTQDDRVNFALCTQRDPSTRFARSGWQGNGLRLRSGWHSHRHFKLLIQSFWGVWCGFKGGEREAFSKSVPFAPFLKPSLSYLCMRAVWNGRIGSFWGGGVWYVVEDARRVAWLFWLILWLFYFWIDVSRIGRRVWVGSFGIHKIFSFWINYIIIVAVIKSEKTKNGRIFWAKG